MTLLVCDNFFNDPDKVVEFANTLDYSNEKYNYPGVRTKDLYKINRRLHQLIVDKIGVLLFPHSKFTALFDIRFQKITKEFGRGVVHTDDSTLTVIIYLNKNDSGFSGTNIYKDSYVSGEEQKTVGVYRESLLRNKKYNEYKTHAEQYNSQFEIDFKISSKYNRCIIFESEKLHCASDYIDEERLTLICFISKIQTSTVPPPILCREIESFF